MLAVRQFEGEDSRSGSDCSAEQDANHTWRGFEDGLGGGVAAQLATPPPQIEIGQSSIANGRGVWTRAAVPAGTRFGPFLGKWVLEPQNDEFAWEVLVPSAGIRGFLDASEFGTWLKYVRRSKEKQNMRHSLLGGQIFYETIRDVNPNEELCLDERQPIQLDSSEDQDKIEEEVKSIVSHEEDELESEENGVKCLVCDKTFPDVYILDKHMVDSHRYEADKYVCEHCSKGFAWRPNLLRHKMIHGEFRRFPCENCDKVFTDPSNLQRHIRTSHVGARCHACPECGKTFATSSGLKQHTHIHSSVKPFRCEVCFKSYTQFSNLCRHKRMHANCRMQIKCHKCGQAFSTVTSLSKHRRFCDSTPSPFLPGHGQHPRMPPLDQSNDLLQNGANHFSHFSNKFAPGSPFLQPPFSHHIQSLFGSPATGNNFPFLQSPHMMFPTMLQRMAMSQLNGKSLISPNAASSPEPKEIKPVIDIKPHHQPENNNGSPTEYKHIMDMKNNIANFKNIEEFRQKLMNGHLDKNPDPEKNGVSSSIHENPQQKQLDVKPKVEENSGHLSRETTPGFDVNRNKSDTESPKVIKPREAPLDLSTPRKGEPEDVLNDSHSDVEEERAVSLSPQPPFSTRNEEKPPTKETNERPESPREKPSHQSEDPEEPRGFKPVGSGKSFIPVTEVSLFPKTTTSDSSAISNTSPFSRPLFSPVDSSLPFPRPVNPFLLGAMYRMNQNPYSSFHPSMSSSLPPIAPRPLPFSSPFMNPLPSSPFLHNNLPLLNRLGCYQDVLSVHNKSKDRYACKFCGKVFPRSANLTRHLRTHTGEQPYKCKYCERSFSISSNLQRHVRNIHNKEKPFKCPLCDRCFGQQTNLDRHLKKHETCSDPSEIVDSPESMKTDEEMGYFDEIRSFMGKVVDKNCSMDASENEVDVEEDDDIITDMD